MRWCVIVVALSLVASKTALAAPRYAITDLGISGETAANVVINNRGLIAISAHQQGIGESNKVYAISDTQPIELPTLGGNWHYIADINDNGTLAGSSQDETTLRHAVTYEDGILHNFGSIAPYGIGLAAINNNGIAIGSTVDPQNHRAVIASGPNTFLVLNTLGGNYSSGSDINNLGQIVGISLTGEPYVAGHTDNPAQEAFLYEDGQMIGLGSLGGHTSNAYGINDKGQVVGESALANGEMHAFLYDALNGMRNLGTPGFQSLAWDINEQGIIIGGVEVAPGNWRAAIFDEMEGPLLLRDLIPKNSGWRQLNRATDINDLGQIVGTGIFSGEQRAFLLTPLIVPEPTAFALASLGLGLLFKRRVI